MIGGILLGLIMGLFLGMCIHREGCEWQMRVERKREKQRQHQKRVQEWERRQKAGIVEGRIV